MHKTCNRKNIKTSTDMNTKIIERINALRNKMSVEGIKATIVPQTDPHQSEYIADHWQVRRWLSGFTGSAGALVVTTDQAFVWADSRYWLQAESQLAGTGIGVMEEGKPGVPTIAEYLCSTLKEGDTVGINGLLFSIDATDALESELNKAGINLCADFDPAAGVWADRPSLPDTEIFIHDEKYAGESAQSKLAKILADANRQGATSALISDLAEIAWALNIRSRDVNFNPVVTSYLLVDPEKSVLFVDQSKLTDDVLRHLDAANVTAKPYSEALKHLEAPPSTAKVLASRNQTSGTIRRILADKLIIGSSPIALLKGCKNETQVEGTRNAMVRDGVALVKAFMEIERKMAEGEKLTEIGVADLLEHFRSQQPLYFDLSFDTIAGFGPHGAIVHYSASPATDATLSPDNLLLVDSGASYLDGTTDITRTITLGNPTDEQRHDFTLVMKGHIALATAVFPVGTRGAQLDVLARIALWKEGLSYLHGTGHGVGHFLNVHEGPQSIRLNENPTALSVGMITSNEPGLYRAGKHGIRCENLVLTVPAFSTEFGDFLRFETITLFPFDLRLFDTELMSDEEIEWVNEYHHEVYRRLSPSLNAAEQEWLKAKTAELTK